jgi:alpha-beta hydrolase superfamily lysophospholipase
VRAASDHLIAADGVRLPTRAWLPDGDAEARAALLIVHGFGEHVGRYDELATRMVAAGYAVHGYDQRGHGYAQGPRAQVRRFEQLLDDLSQVAASVRAWHPDVPLVLFGHSMGGVVASRAVQTERVRPDLLVLSSPVFRDGMAVPGWLRTLLTRLAEVVPDLPTVRLDTSALSRDAAEVAAYVQDPAVFHGPVKARLASELAKHGALALAEAERLRVPLLIVHGKDDRLAQPGASGELQRALADRDATLQLYDEGMHELFHDSLRDRVTGDVLAWLDERLPPDGRAARDEVAVSAGGRRGPPRT